MANKNSNYWRKRTLQLEDALHNKGIEYYHDLERLYKRAAKETEKEISKLYGRLATENGITLSEAKKLLTSNELEEFRWSVQEYIKYGKKNTLDKLWTKQLENASLKYRISRLEAMKIHMQQQVEVLMGNELDSFSKVMTDIYTEGYYRNAHLIQTGMGVGSSFAALDTNKIEKVLSKPWVGNKNFSQRIWGDHRTTLINDLHTHLTQSIIRGEAPDRAIKFIAEKYDVAKHRAGNLVMTESAYFGTKAQQDCYKELGVEMQEFVATLDSRTSDICQEMDGKVFKTNELEIGVNAPPLHGRCRSVLVPYFEDNITERAARDEDGKTVYVDGNMKYADWKKQFVDGDTVIDNVSDVVKIISYDTAKTTLQSRGIEFDDSLKKIDEKLLIENSNRLNELLDKYPQVQNYINENKFYFVSENADDIASITTDFDISKQKLSLNTIDYKNYDSHLALQKKQILSGFSMPCSEKNYSTYTITHEFGHAIQNTLIKKHHIANANKVQAVLDKGVELLNKGNIAQSRKIMRDYVEKITIEHKNEILKIIKEIKPDTTKQEYIANLSRYSMKNPAEFFAEAFANSECGEPNIIGKAMKIFLERNLK